MRQFLNDYGSLVTLVINVILVFLGLTAILLHWPIIAIVGFGVGAFGVLGATWDLDYFEAIEDFYLYLKRKIYGTDNC